MGSLGFWSMIAILFQTSASVILSWLILECKFTPSSRELHEVTLMKILYLYDPEACGRIYFYNLTSTANNEKAFSSVMWPVNNFIAARFRTKVKLWLSLHLIWTIFAVINVTQGQRSCSFYATLLPFTITGVTLLLADVINAVLFLIDARYTKTEGAIIRYMASNGHLRSISKRPIMPGMLKADDTSWIAVLLAYISIRGIVQWIVNFWIVKDNYFEGLNRYRGKHRKIAKHKVQIKSPSLE